MEFKKFEDFNSKEKTSIDERKDYHIDDVSGGIKDTLQYFGVNKVSEISKAKNWAKVMKQVKGDIGRYVGFKIDPEGSIEVIGEKGWAKVQFDGSVFFEASGPLFK